jgi:ABC-type uncharacterized transport system auxiliary subunit
MQRTAILAVAVLAGCSFAASRAAPPAQTYQLSYAAPAPAALPAPVTLRVVPFGGAAAYDRVNFLYRRGTYEVGVDSYHRWVATPGGMVSDLLARDIAATNAVQAVLQAPSALPSDYELNGQVEIFEENDAGGCSAHLRLRVFLVRVPPSGPRAVVADDIFDAQEPCRPGDPASFAAAMSRAVERASEAIRAQISLAVTSQ